jgi:hypothetical protein
MIATGLRIQLLVAMATIISILSCLRGAVPMAPACGGGADVMGTRPVPAAPAGLQHAGLGADVMGTGPKQRGSNCLPCQAEIATGSFHAVR